MKSCWMVLLIMFLLQIEILKKNTYAAAFWGQQRKLESLAILLMKVTQKLGLHKGSSFL